MLPPRPSDLPIALKRFPHREGWEVLMFDSVTIDSSHLNAGSVAEALIYYGEVTVSVGGGALVQFVREFGSGNLMRAIGMGALHITFDRHGYAVTTANNPFRVHDFGGVSLVKTADGRAINSAWDEIDHLFQQEFGSTPQSRRLRVTLQIECNCATSTLIFHNWQNATRSIAFS